MTFSRVDWLQQKLTETGHEAQQRIDWEIELATALEKKLTPRKTHPIVRKPAIIKEWNRKILRGWKDEQYGKHRLPMNYIFHHDFIIPPYLQRAWILFRQGKTVFGVTTRCPDKKKTKGVTWASDKGKNHLKSSSFSRAIYDKALAEFFQAAPLVTYEECVARFPESALTGSLTGKEIKRECDFDIKQRTELNLQKKARAKAWAEQQLEAKQKKVALKRAETLRGWEAAEQALAERKAAIATQWDRVKAGEAAFIAKHGMDVIAYEVKQKAEQEAKRKEDAKPKKLSLKQRMAAAHKKLNA